MNRRESLKALGLMAAGSGLLAGACKDAKQKPLAEKWADKLPGVQDFEHERNLTLAEEVFFDPHEMATITVLVDLIIPKDAISESASAAGVPAFIEFMVKDLPDNKIPMRGGLKWLDMQAQKLYGAVFINCKDSEQIAFVNELAYPALAKPAMRQGVAFFSLLRNFTASGFFTSEIGVKDLGYVGNRPGVWNGVPEDVLKEHGFEVGPFFG